MKDYTKLLRYRIGSNINLWLTGAALLFVVLPNILLARDFRDKTNWLFVGSSIAVIGSVDRWMAHDTRVTHNDESAIRRQVARESLYEVLKAAPQLEDEDLQIEDVYKEFDLVEAFKKPDYPHYLLIAPSGSGKTTFMSWMLELAQESGSDTTVLSPHRVDDEFDGHKAIYDKEEIYQFIDDLHGEMRARYKAAEKSGWTKVAHKYDHMTVAIDEAVSLFADFKDMDKTLGGDVQKKWVQLLVEARKVGIRLIVASQSTRVDCLGLRNRGDVGECLTKILLGKSAKGRLAYIRRKKLWPEEHIDFVKALPRFAIVNEADLDHYLVIPDLS